MNDKLVLIEPVIKFPRSNYKKWKKLKGILVIFRQSDDVLPCSGKTEVRYINKTLRLFSSPYTVRD